GGAAGVGKSGDPSIGVRRGLGASHDASLAVEGGGNHNGGGKRKEEADSNIHGTDTETMGQSPIVTDRKMPGYSKNRRSEVPAESDLAHRAARFILGGEEDGH